MFLDVVKKLKYVIMIFFTLKFDFWLFDFWFLKFNSNSFVKKLENNSQIKKIDFCL